MKELWRNLSSLVESGLGDSKNTAASSQPETPGSNQVDSLKCWMSKPGNVTQEAAKRKHTA